MELLLVLVILGILAAIVLPRFTNRTKQAQIAAVQTQIASFKTALDAYEVDNGGYPKGKNGLLDLDPAAARRSRTGTAPISRPTPSPRIRGAMSTFTNARAAITRVPTTLAHMGPPGDNMVLGNWTVKR